MTDVTTQLQLVNEMTVAANAIIEKIGNPFTLEQVTRSITNNNNKKTTQLLSQLAITGMLIGTPKSYTITIDADNQKINLMNIKTKLEAQKNAFIEDGNAKDVTEVQKKEFKTAIKNIENDITQVEGFIKILF